MSRIRGAEPRFLGPELAPSLLDYAGQARRLKLSTHLPSALHGAV